MIFLTTGQVKKFKQILFVPHEVILLWSSRDKIINN